MTTTTLDHLEELAHRANDGVEVALYWNRTTDALTVVVDDAGSGDLFEIAVEAQNAMDAFHHPYAYAAHSGIEYVAGNREPVYA
jgi:phosphoglycolate phosphatase-like HAD superfamily hydrolase